MRILLIALALLGLLHAPISFAATMSGEDGDDDQEISVTDTTPKSLDWIKNHCVDVPSETACKVTESGKIGIAGSKAYYYNLYKVLDGNIEEPGVSVFEQEKDGMLAPIENLLMGDLTTASISGPPFFTEYKNNMLLTIPVFMSGTGEFNANISYILDKDKFVRFDTDSWLSDYMARDKNDTKLPHGYAILKGVFPEFGKDKITASSPVWKESDGNCCPSGGWIDLEFDIKNDALVVINQKFQKIDDEKKVRELYDPNNPVYQGNHAAGAPVR